MGLGAWAPFVRAEEAPPAEGVTVAPPEPGGTTPPTESAPLPQAPAPASDNAVGDPASDEGREPEATEGGVTTGEVEVDPDVQAFLRSQGVGPEANAHARPSIDLGGFANVNVSGASDDHGVDFLVGQLVLHGLADLTHGFGAFFEVSVNSTPIWETRVERLLLSWDVSDNLKLSLGRFHIPVTWWNSTFHHGLWLQTTARRPLMIGYSDAFIANHAVGLLAEGAVPGADELGLRYHVAVSSGGDDHRHTAESTMHSHDDGRLAWTAALSIEPRAVPHLRVGLVAFADPFRERDGERVSELALGAHIAYTSDDPEFIAEYVLIRHEMPGLDETYYSHGMYAQLAWRFDGAGTPFKPYLRYERMSIDEDDPTLATSVSQHLGLVGLRFDATAWCALKLEGVWRHPDGESDIFEGIFQTGVAW